MVIISIKFAFVSVLNAFFLINMLNKLPLSLYNNKTETVKDLTLKVRKMLDEMRNQMQSTTKTPGSSQKPVFLNGARDLKKYI